MKEAPIEPVPMEQEIEFMLETAALYLEKKPAKADILSTFAGIRPLAKAGDGGNTSALSRDHVINIDKSGLVNIAGGKWTTYRNMAEDCVDQAATLADLPDRPCVTKTLNIEGFHPNAAKFGPLAVYGADAIAIKELSVSDPSLGQILDSALPYTSAEVVWSIRHEMARTVEDVLARRLRALFLNAKAAVRMAPRVAALLAQELNRDKTWELDQIEKFNQLAAGFMVKL
jgi:glycerol-3-phosphate dehydrogenase